MELCPAHYVMRGGVVSGWIDCWKLKNSGYNDISFNRVWVKQDFSIGELVNVIGYD